MSTLQQDVKKGYPSGVAFIALTQMWESFSYFGMRVLLVLCLTTHLEFSNASAFTLYALYIALVQIFAVFGGYIADRFLGYSQGTVLGGVLIMLGHIFLSIFGEGFFLFLALGSIVIGSSIFRVSLQSLLGLLYEKDSSEREKGFTLFYVGMNLGGISAAILCGFIAEIYGWHAGFGLAALGMLIGMILFIIKKKKLPISTKAPRQVAPLKVGGISLISVVAIGVALYFFSTVQYFAFPFAVIALGGILYVLSKNMTRRSLYSVVGILILLILYFTAEELWGSLLMVFSENQVNRSVFGFTIPSAVIAAMNPLVIIVLGPLIAKSSMRFGAKLTLSFLCLSLAFFLFYYMALIENPSALYLCLGLSFIALGEVLLTPVALAFAFQAAPEKSSGLMMGATTLALALGTLLSGEISKFSLDVKYTFLGIGGVSLVVFLLLSYFLKTKMLKERRMINPKKNLPPATL